MSSSSAEMPFKFGRDNYKSAPQRPAPFPTASFFIRTLAGPMRRLWQKALRGQCDDRSWAIESCLTAEIFENIGGRLEIDGLEHVANMDRPCVYIANHMSTLETFLLPGILRPFGAVTFVVKESLTTMPGFGPIMRSRDPVVVRRINPREDLETVFREGPKRLANGVSVIVFPQHSRSPRLDEKTFNSIGVKLAARANAPAIPLALKTDAWTNGRKIKELGRIRPEFPVHFKFGAPISVSGSGKEEHRQILDFISGNVRKWQASEGINA